MAPKSYKPHPSAPESGHEHLLGKWLTFTCDFLALDAEKVNSEYELAVCVQRGFPARSIDALVEHGIPDRQIFDSVISRRTFHRRRAGKENLTPEESDRAERFGRMLALATLVLGDEIRAAHWLSEPKARLEGHPPVEMLVSSVGAKVVEDLLLQAYFGLVA